MIHVCSGFIFKIYRWVPCWCICLYKNLILCLCVVLFVRPKCTGEPLNMLMTVIKFVAELKNSIFLMQVHSEHVVYMCDVFGGTFRLCGVYVWCVRRYIQIMWCICVMCSEVHSDYVVYMCDVFGGTFRLCGVYMWCVLRYIQIMWCICVMCSEVHSDYVVYMCDVFGGTYIQSMWICLIRKSCQPTSRRLKGPFPVDILWR